ncbi:agenet domain-containing protein, partial [Tanacetum coccineum]
SGNEIDMYVEHFGYDIMELIKLEVNEEHNHNSIEESDDEYYEPLADPDDHQIHDVNKVQSGVLYPAFDPDIPWDKMEPTLEIWKKEDVLVKKVIKIGCSKVEHADNWGWFLHLLHDDLSLNDENRITIISDSHKGLIDAIKQLDEGAYDYLIKRNLNSWSRAFFDMDMRCAAFENGISESFNIAILKPRHKPIITMLEEIGLYIMQRLVAMNKIATNLQDTITPSIRKRLEVLKEKQREWLVIPSGFQELEVRKDDQSYGVNLQHKVCQCRMWELSGVPCVHAVAAYLHCGIEIDLGVSHWGRGRGRGGSENEASVSGMGGIDEASGGGRGGTGGRGRRGRGMESSVGGEEVVVEIIELLVVQEVEWLGQLDEEAFRECLEEQAREQAKNDAEQEREDSLEEAPFNHTYAEVLIPSIHSQPTQHSGVWVKDTTNVTTEYVDEFPGMETSETTNMAEGIGSAMKEELPAPAADKGKGVASVSQQDNAPTKKRGRPPSHVDGVRIYHKNRGRSERISKMKEKKAFEFDKHGTSSTPDKAFDVSD